VHLLKTWLLAARFPTAYTGHDTIPGKQICITHCPIQKGRQDAQTYYTLPYWGFPKPRIKNVDRLF